MKSYKKSKRIKAIKKDNLLIAINSLMKNIKRFNRKLIKKVNKCQKYINKSKFNQ